MTEAPITSTESHNVPQHRIPVFMSGLGKMGALVAEALIRDPTFLVLPIGLSSENHFGQSKYFYDPESGRDQNIVFRTKERWTNSIPEGTIVIDYTATASVEDNVRFYISHGLPFVMGTSTGDKERLQRLTEMVAASDISAVIAPNMNPQIVGRQMEIDDMAAASPAIFQGATVQITEIHQPSKVNADGTPSVSGTAIAFREQYEGYGTLPGGKIESIRYQPDHPVVQAAFEGAELDPQKGYAYHDVVVTDAQGNIIHSFKTRVIGRGHYVVGTLVAARFLAEHDEPRHVWTMVDVLREGDTNA